MIISLFIQNRFKNYKSKIKKLKSKNWFALKQLELLKGSNLLLIDEFNLSLIIEILESIALLNFFFKKQFLDL